MEARSASPSSAPSSSIPPAEALAPAKVPASAPAPVAPALPTLTRAGELFAVVVDGPTARCEAWTIEPAERVLRSQRDAHELTFEVTGQTLAITELTRFRGGVPTESTSCHLRFEARETEQAIAIDGAKLFRTAAACAAAIQRHERVAVKLDCDFPEERTPERVQQATRTKLEALLASGGTLHSIVDGPGGDTCRAVRVRAAKARDRGWLGGAFEYDVVRDDGVRGTTSLGYEMKRGSSTITFFGPGTTWRDGSAQGLGCMDDTTISFRESSVVLAEPVYFTAAACRAAIELERAQQSWYPLPPGEEVAGAPAQLGEPALGGC